MHLNYIGALIVSQPGEGEHFFIGRGGWISDEKLLRVALKHVNRTQIMLRMNFNFIDSCVEDKKIAGRINVKCDCILIIYE